MGAQKDQHPEIASAIRSAGNQVELAKLLGCAQQTVSKLLNREISVPAELAKKIDKVTGGEVPCWKLRPDLWDPPARVVPEAAAPVPA